MNLHVPLEHRFLRTSDGLIWTAGNLSYDFWTRYLSVFHSVTVVGRVQNVDRSLEGWKLVEGPGVRFSAVPGYQGPAQFVRQFGEVRSAMSALSGNCGAVILRVPGMISRLYQRYAMDESQPFGAEIVGDPWEVYSPGAISHPLRPVLRRISTRTLKRVAGSASAVAYVSSLDLPQRYPPVSGTFTTSYSSIELSRRHFVPSPRLIATEHIAQPNVIMVGSLEQRYKGADVLLNAMKVVRQSIPEARLTIVGDGRYRPELEAQTKRLGMTDRVSFVGQLPAGDAVREQLDAATLFVLPSRTEGLPRAMIEAMARGLPCIGTSVGGIPELLQPEFMVLRDDVTALAETIITVLSSPQMMERMSAQNIQVARNYDSEILQARRDEFYRVVRDKTEAWLKTREEQE